MKILIFCHFSIFSKRQLIPYDALVTVSRFFRRRDAIRFISKSRALDETFRYNPAIMIGERRFVEDMHVYYKMKEKQWLATPSRPLPLTKPPPSILGFNNITIGIAEQFNLEVWYIFYSNSILDVKLRFLLIWKNWHWDAKLELI